MKYNEVKEVEVNIVVTSAKDFVLPMNMDYEGHKLCDQDCMESID